jgi:tricarballylate dehydrogenase
VADLRFEGARQLRDEYRIKRMTKVRADTIEELATKLEGVNQEQFLKTIKEWNAAVMTEVPFNPAVKDGRGVRGLAVPKSNWANTIDQPPFEAYAVTCGLTFTFGGLKITTTARSRAPTATSSPACSPRASWSAGCSITTTPAAPGWCPARCWASSRATAPASTSRARLTCPSGLRLGMTQEYER